MGISSHVSIRNFSPYKILISVIKKKKKKKKKSKQKQTKKKSTVSFDFL